MSKPNIYDTGFSERMTKIIEKEGVSINSFAQKLGVSPPTISRWMKGEADPTRSNLIKLAEQTGINIEWLAIGAGPKYWQHPITEEIILRGQPQPIESSNDETFSVIEDCREVRISAGGGGFNDEYKPYQTTKVEKAWLDSRCLKAEDCAMFLVSGDSMYPTLKDGEEIIVDRSKKELKDGKIFVLNNEGAMLVKKVQITYNGIILISQNTEYAPIELNAEQANNLIVIGQVVRGYRDF
ncbi:LexA family transcriptional regulator [Pasteurella bettyae]|uniref:Bacteriophage CI repressor protein n=1 Tax=Pasteurella bettyae CCUG 2042 TaxID=1095749 RepID=I3D9C5_9PAST|nr:S24 family peptidase [Pasteurella bettyae]EIJ68318.1 bacteriophage CI repressor protein [Pasteurella bettyae CCUG 2042]SUB23003.1 putative bacteriophage transcriptional regulator [Pasteurella bettyae]